MKYRKTILSLIITIVFCLISCSSISKMQINKDVLLKQEEEQIKYIAEGILNYINDAGKKGGWCLNPYANECNDINIRHIKNIVKIITDHGWNRKIFILKAALLKNRKLIIAIVFASKVDKKIIYKSLFIIDDDKDSTKYKKYNVYD